ncbi:MAG TPA: acyl-CoA dehydrogenase family protein [Ramlibacter sp.]|nr:acyl-CoA dehydrogenase family protein [Ramlibacter sp.]
MNIAFSAEDMAFREAVRDFLGRALTPELRAACERQAGVYAEPELSRRWHRVLFEQGWIAPAWPKEYGGPGWTPVQRYIFDTECAAAGTPLLPAMGLQMCGPVLMHYGTPAQKDFFLPRILSGEHSWCQGYSEPQAGSDLASLSCRATRDGEHYVINGTKIWTTHAHVANWMFLLVRTDPSAKPQAGITFLLTPMNAPGITVHPIRSMSGEHEVNQVFFDDVRVPLANRVGEENQGWTVAKYLLEFERGGGSHAAKIRRVLHAIKSIGRQEKTGAGAPLITDPAFSRKLAELEVALMALDVTERRVVSGLSTGRPAGNSMASMLKLRGSELMQKATELALEALGLYGAPDQRHALGMHATGTPIGPNYALTPAAKYLNMRAATVFGGSAEIQRTILARAALAFTA